MASKKSNWVREILAGGTAGMVGVGVGHPLDTIKVHQQINSISFTQSAINIFKRQGVVGFLRGISVPLMSNGLIFSTFFSTYNGSLVLLTSPDRLHLNPNKSLEDMSSMSQVFLAGCFGGFTQTFVSGPVELIKVQMQMSRTGKVCSSFSTIKYIYQLRGTRGFGVGLGATFLRDVHSHGVYTLVYRECLDFFWGKESQMTKHKAPAISLFMAGGLAGILFWWCCIPMDVVKSRLQGDSLVNPKYKNSWDCTIKIYKEHGLKPFMRGFGATTLRSFPANGSIFLVYEKFRDGYEWVTGS